MTPFCYRKKGISPVLGVLLMVGILLTTIIPTYLYVNQVDNFYDRAVVDMKIADQERSMEDVEAYAFGHTETSEAIDLFLINRGPVTVCIARIWAMRTDLNKTLIFTSENESSPLPLQLIASNQMTLESLVITILEHDPDVDYFNIYVTTTRGNTFSASTNPIQYDGGWKSRSTPPWIEVLIRSNQEGDDYQIDAVSEGGSNYTIEAKNVHGDLFTIIPVIDFGVYNVTAWNTRHEYKVGSVFVNLERGNPVALAYFNDLPAS